MSSAHRIAIAAALALIAACGGPSQAPSPALRCHEMPFAVAGTQGQPIDAKLTSNVFVVPLIVGTTAVSGVLDTGAPVTLLDPSAFPNETLPHGQGTVSSLTLGGQTVADAGVVGASAGLATEDGPIPVLVGGDLLCHFLTSFDYRQPRVFLGAGTLPSDLSSPVTVVAPIEGGGLGALSIGGSRGIIAISPTRIAVTAQLEGTERHFVLDTGATLTTLRKSLFTTLKMDGRKTVTGLGASTAMGVVGVEVARARSLSVGGADVTGSLIAELDDPLFDSLGQEVGHRIDGLLGGTWLREHLVTIDYAKGEVQLRRYPDRAHVKDEFIRLGFTMTPVGTRYRVQVVFASSDAAAQGLAAGTEIIDVDGTTLDGLTPSAANAQLLGTAGTTKSVRTPSGTLNIRVEDLL